MVLPSAEEPWGIPNLNNSRRPKCRLSAPWVTNFRSLCLQYKEDHWSNPSAEVTKCCSLTNCRGTGNFNLDKAGGLQNNNKCISKVSSLIIWRTKLILWNSQWLKLEHFIEKEQSFQKKAFLVIKTMWKIKQYNPVIISYSGNTLIDTTERLDPQE